MSKGWNRVKIFMIAVLCALNLFLLYMIREQARESEYLPEVSVQQIVKLLEKDGITIKDGALSRKKATSSLYGGTMGASYYTDTASAVSGSAVSLSFPSPSGVVLSMENGDRCAFDGGFQIRYEAAGFSALLEEKGFFETDYTAAGINTMLSQLTAREERALTAAVESFLLRANGMTDRSAPYPVGYELLCLGKDDVSGLQVFICVQTVRGMRVANLCSAIAVLDGEVIGMSGEWCFAEIKTTYSAPLYDQIHILYSVKERILSEGDAAPKMITSMSLGYAVYYHADTEAFYMIPVWNITTDVGKTYLYNSLNGALYTD
ncbi:MAG: hypothetical protein IJZ08_03670 [Clostridia bacterium]|nr:hypothetical protein [Clostridia bacterium]